MATKKNYQTLSTELDTILAALQSPDTSIDEALTLYEKGQKVVTELEEYLQTAENKVRQMQTLAEEES